MPSARFKTALVLSGGGARALTHLGVLEELQKNRLQIDLIVGASMGAIIGGLYAYYGDVGKTADIMRNFLQSKLFQETLASAVEDSSEDEAEGVVNGFLRLFKRGVYWTQSILRSTLVPEETYLEIMSDLMPEHPVEDLPIPFAAVALDIGSGEEVVLRTGSLREVASASAAIPGLLPPVRFDGRFLADGGWVDNIPALPAVALGAHFVVAVDASTSFADLGHPPVHAIDHLLRCDEITRIHLNHQRRSLSDIVLLPEVGSMHWADFGEIEHCMAAGRIALAENLWRIRLSRLRRQFLTLKGRIRPATPPGSERPLVFY